MLTKKIVKYIQSLSHKKFRDEENAFIAEGPKVVEEFLLAKKNECVWLLTEEEWVIQQTALVQSLSPERIIIVTNQRLAGISALKTPNKVLAVFKKSAERRQPDLNGKISILLDDLQDPGNMGTIIRIADWFGIQHIICSPNSVDCYNPKVVQATMGSLARMDVLYTDLLPFVQKYRNIPLYAAVLEGRSVYIAGRIAEGLLLIGNESKGIRKDLLRMAEHTISIPRVGNAESLNAAVATGIILSHIGKNSV